MENYILLGMGKEVENLIMENNELLATKWVFYLNFIIAYSIYYNILYYNIFIFSEMRLTLLKTI